MPAASTRRVRRRIEQVSDQLWVRARRGHDHPPVVLDEPRWALCTVNFSTTRYLKLLLLTLSEQHRLDLLCRIVIADNACHGVRRSCERSRRKCLGSMSSRTGAF